MQELARAAPDLYLEQALVSLQHLAVRPALALAAGLRGRRTAVPALLRLSTSRSRCERLSSCRALGWIGDGAALDALIYALGDPSWQVRLAAARALSRINDPSRSGDVALYSSDPNPAVRRTLGLTLLRLRAASGPANLGDGVIGAAGAPSRGW